jgi:O-antigen/teichoic acid export membrane protein
MFVSLRNRLQSSTGRFFKSSILLAGGFAIARVLGLFFSLLLVRVLPAESYGAIQYSILLAGIIAIGTQPLMQHAAARFVSVSRADPERLNRVVSTSFWLLGIVTVLTLVVVACISLVTGVFDLGALIIFLGFTVYYGYYGLARGFEDSPRLSLLFIGSNLIQFVALLVVYYALASRATLPALLIYGGSYILAVAALLIVRPLPVRPRLALVDRAVGAEIARFSLPVWASHAMFALGAAGEVLVLTALVGEAAAGVFAFTRTLTMAFDFLPSAISTIIMPRVANATGERLTQISVGLVLLVNLGMGAVFLLLYPWFVTTFFDASYLLPVPQVLLMIVAQTLGGIHGILAGVVVGRNRPTVEFINRLLWVICLYASCYLLIPRLGIEGAILAGLLTVIVCIAAFLIPLPRRPLSASS